MHRQVDRQRRPGRAEGRQRLPLRHRAGAAGHPGEDDALCHPRDSKFAGQGGSRRREGGNAGRHGVGDAVPPQATDLLGDRAVDGQVTGVEPGHVLPARVGSDVLRFDAIQVQRRGIDQPRTGPAMRQQRGRDDRAGVKTHRTPREKVPPPQRYQIGRPRAGADEMNRHGTPLSASAQVARPLLILANSRRPSAPATASAHPSATDATPTLSSAAAELVAHRACSAVNAACATHASGMPSRAAASKIPCSLYRKAGAASIPAVRSATSSAWRTRAVIVSRGQSGRQPMPATITASPPPTA